MRYFKSISAIALCVSLAACGRTADTSSPAAYTSSMQAMTKDLPADKRAKLQAGLVALTFNTTDPAQGIWSQADPTSPIFLGAGDKIKGKTADQIIRAGYEARIGLLDAAIAEDAAAAHRIVAERKKYAAVFDNVHIDGARYSIEHSFIDQPVISFTITNGSKIPIKRIYLHGILTSPGRSIPWVSGDINYAFSGGIEPGEVQHLDLEPNMFGEWKIDDAYSKRPDLKLEMSVSNVEGADGQQILHGDPGDAAEKTADAAAKQKARSDLAAEMAKL